MLIGVTGQIGAGKSAAAEVFRKAGAFVIDADHIGREVVDRSMPLRNRLKKAFGPDILDKKGRLKRKTLAARAFASNAGHIRLNALVHPYLLKELRKQMQLAQKKFNLVVVDAALLLDWNLDKEMDFVLVVHTSLERRLKRLLKRGISHRDALARIKNQLPFKIFHKKADRVILNNGSRADLSRKIKAWLVKIIHQTD